MGCKTGGQWKHNMYDLCQFDGEIGSSDGLICTNHSLPSKYRLSGNGPLPRPNEKPGYTAGGCIASVLLIEATEQLNRRLSIFSVLLKEAIN
jgi:hypothetical protein